MSVWGGPDRRVRVVLAFTVVQALLVMVGGLGRSVPLIGAALFGVLFCFPFIGGCGQVIWQRKVAPEVQGRVFAIRRMISWSSFPLAFIVSGLLADRVFEPAMSLGGALAATVGRVLGVGKGSGIGLLYALVGATTLAIVAVAAASPRLRSVEAELPDRLEEPVAPGGDVEVKTA
jgi:MFS transporter, DHA3 family, macrolide efflux protein